MLPFLLGLIFCFTFFLCYVSCFVRHIIVYVQQVRNFHLKRERRKKHGMINMQIEGKKWKRFFLSHSGAKFAKFDQNSIIKGAKMENVVKLWQNYVFKIISPLVFVLAFLLFLDISRVHCGFRFWYWLFYGNKSKQLAIFSDKNLSRS